MSQAVEPVIAGPWRLTRFLGQSNAIRYFLAKHEETEELAMAKVISKSSITADATLREQIHTEIRVLLALNRCPHPNIIQLQDLLLSDDHIFLLFEACTSGDLHEILTARGEPFSEAEAFNIFSRLIDAVEHLHAGVPFSSAEGGVRPDPPPSSNTPPHGAVASPSPSANSKRCLYHVFHRDITLENITYGSDQKIRLDGFASAAAVAVGPKRLLVSWVGSPYYTAPEVILHEPYSGAAADVFGLGVVLYALLTTSLPFVGQGEPSCLVTSSGEVVDLEDPRVDEDPYASVRAQIVFDEPPLLTKGGDTEKDEGGEEGGAGSDAAPLSASVKDLLRKMLRKSASERATVASIREHEWFTAQAAAAGVERG